MKTNQEIINGLLGEVRDYAADLLFYNRKYGASEIDKDELNQVLSENLLTKQDFIKAFEEGLDDWWI